MKFLLQHVVAPFTAGEYSTYVERAVLTPVGSCEQASNHSQPCFCLQAHQCSSMDCLAAVTSMSYFHSTPVKTHSDCPGTRLPTLMGRTAMQSVNDSPSLSANSGPDSLTLATDSLTAARHGQTQSPDVHGSPPRSIRRMVCPGAPKKRLPTNSFSACTDAAARDSQWHHAAQAAPLRQDLYSDRQAMVMSKLTSRASPIHSAQGLLNRLNQMGATAVVAPGACTITITEAADSTIALGFDDGAGNELRTGDGSVGELAAVRLPQQAGHGPRQGFTRGALATCSPGVGPQLKRIKSDTTLDVAATTQAGSFQPAAGTSHFTQEAREGVQQDQAPVRADDPVDSVVNRAANHGHLALHNSPGTLCTGNAAPDAVLAFTQGTLVASQCLALVHTGARMHRHRCHSCEVAKSP